MGSVWLADHLTLQTQVVVKFMHAAVAGDSAGRERFTREAIAASRVKSPHVVQTFDHGVTSEGVPFIVMERLEGEDLGRRIQKGFMSPAEVASTLTQVCRALSRAHAAGIVHRDIKPENIFLCDVGSDEPFVKLLDFGIAKNSLNPTLEKGTQTGAMMGTPYYMSPEQFSGAKDIDYRTDLWSLGIVAYEALTGVRPFDASTIGGLAIAVYTATFAMPSQIRPHLGAGIDAWFRKACARPVAERFSSAKEFAEAFSLAAGLRPGAITGGDSVQAREPSVNTGPVAVERATADRVTDGLLLTTNGSVAVESEPTAAGIPKRGRAKVVLAAAAAVGVVGVLVAAVALSHGSSSGPAAAGLGSASASAASEATVTLTTLEPARTTEPLVPSSTAPVAPSSPGTATPPHQAKAATLAPGATLPTVASHAAPAPQKAAANCSPPFTIDRAGVKHPKPECL
jgi:serine/threonine-protein kinase